MVVRETLLSNGMAPTGGRDWLIQWSGPGLRDAAYQEMNEFQRVNHFPGSTELTRKDRLWLNFSDMAETFGSEAFNFMPQTFVLPEQVQEFLEVYNQKGGLWIVKPHASSRGRGIFVLKDVSELPLNEVSVVSQYVADPLLIQGLKFDLRVYVLVTSYEPLRAYVYREGLVRFACRPYSTDAKHISDARTVGVLDAYRHLTNYSINKGSASFVENSDVQNDNMGHKWSISALNRHLRCTGVDVKLMWTRIMDVLVKSLLAVEPTISARTRVTANHSHNCFELYGFDILVDKEPAQSDLKPWLLEVNLSPSMQADSRHRGSLLADSFNLVGINRVSKQRLAEATRAKAKVLKVPGKPPGPPERRKRPAISGKSTLLRTSAESVMAEEVFTSVPLGALELEELRSTANALLECTRNQNFIRLFPTSRAVKHYGTLVDSLEAMKPWPRGRKPAQRMTASQVLSSLLFGPPPTHNNVFTERPRSRALLYRTARLHEDPSGPGEEEAEEAALPRVRCLERNDSGLARCSAVTSPHVPRVDLRRGAGASSAALRVDPAMEVLVENGCRLAIVEYLLRVRCHCARLSTADRQKATWPEVTARLLAFCSSLHGEGGPVDEVVDRLEDTCHAELCRMVNLGEEDPTMFGLGGLTLPVNAINIMIMLFDPWKGRGANLDDRRVEDTRLAKLMPSMMSTSAGRQAAHGMAVEQLNLMTAAELERFLLSSMCDVRFRAPLENYLLAGWMGSQLQVNGTSFGHTPRTNHDAGGWAFVRAVVLAFDGGPLRDTHVARQNSLFRSPEKTTSRRRVVVMQRTPAEALMTAATEDSLASFVNFMDSVESHKHQDSRVVEPVSPSKAWRVEHKPKTCSLGALLPRGEESPKKMKSMKWLPGSGPCDIEL
ncbi:Tubulin polyglutamylase TTLL5 (SRC1 and TIF2-associated modulatory protein) (Tubulin--tyrosine ligase-like protein 5) [Durusdinium trenchii]|uniref:Tubulin--tyrosine ligase-like protein 5 n=1 Tax=Durusdinium trenchii TaxID=1381693 RepID=A0ABP0PX55_9DINO